MTPDHWPNRAESLTSSLTWRDTLATHAAHHRCGQTGEHGTHTWPWAISDDGHLQWAADVSYAEPHDPMQLGVAHRYVPAIS